MCNENGVIFLRDGSDQLIRGAWYGSIFEINYFVAKSGETSPYRLRYALIQKQL